MGERCYMKGLRQAVISEEEQLADTGIFLLTVCPCYKII